MKLMCVSRTVDGHLTTDSVLLFSNNFQSPSLDIVKQSKVSRWSTYPTAVKHTPLQTGAL